MKLEVKGGDKTLEGIEKVIKLLDEARSEMYSLPSKLYVEVKPDGSETENQSEE